MAIEQHAHTELALGRGDQIAQRAMIRPIEQVQPLLRLGLRQLDGIDLLLVGGEARNDAETRQHPRR
jgi:hypothetical protein